MRACYPTNKLTPARFWRRSRPQPQPDAPRCTSAVPIIRLQPCAVSGSSKSGKRWGESSHRLGTKNRLAQKEFHNMAKLTIVFGLVLILLGIWGFVATGSASAHSSTLFPTWFGLALAVCGLLALTEDEKRRRLWMHAATVLGLVGGAGNGNRVDAGARRAAGLSRGRRGPGRDVAGLPGFRGPVRAFLHRGARVAPDRCVALRLAELLLPHPRRQCASPPVELSIA